MAEVLSTAANQSDGFPNSSVTTAAKTATSTILIPNTGVASDTSPRSREMKFSTEPNKKSTATIAGCHSNRKWNVPPRNNSGEKVAAQIRFATNVVRQKPTPKSAARRISSA